MDIGDPNKYILLTGAGFSCNWGAPASAGIWDELIGQKNVQADSELRNFLIQQFDNGFEVAYQLAKDTLSEESCLNFDKALNLVFSRINNLNYKFTHPNYLALINHFSSHIQDGQINKNRSDFFFTLNQDLLVERTTIQSHSLNNFIRPGIEQSDPLRRPFDSSYNMGKAKISFNEEINLKGQLNYIKLHGSSDLFEDGAPSARMIIGSKKVAEISKIPLLQYYHQIFKNVLKQKDRRLMIIGYGFGDGHINEVIADAVEENGLKVLIWGAKGTQSIKDSLFKASPHGSIIWRGLIRTYSKSFEEIFSRSMPFSGSGRDIPKEIEEFFEI